MSSNLPTPTSSRGRLARASTTTRIPTPRRETSIPTPRRSSRTPTESTLPTPRRETSLPTPRRTSRSATDTARTPRRSIRPTPPDHSATPPSSVPRRLSAAADNPPTRPAPSPAAFRRVSSAHEHVTARQRPSTTARFVRNASNPPTDTTPRRLPTRQRQLPDRDTAVLASPSPTPSRRQTTATPVSSSAARQPLKQSPYARRSSASGPGRGVGSPQVTRKLNMAPGDEDEHTSSGGKRLLGLSSAARRTSGSRADAAVRRLSGSRGEVGRAALADRGTVADRLGAKASTVGRSGVTDRGFSSDRVEKRRDSGSGKRPGVSALESFRAARRASAEHAEAEERKNAAQLDMKPQPAVSGSSSAAGVAAFSTQATPDIEMKEPLPDRPDPIIPTATMTQQKRTPAKPLRRTSARFSDADVCLNDVERLRCSLGRRRSKSANDGDPPEPPKLRRTSLTGSIVKKKEEENNDVHMSENDVPKVDMEIRTSPVLGSRAPLQSIQTLTGNVLGGNVLGNASGNPPPPKKNSKENNNKRLSFVPQLDDDDGWANEEVEDLGIW